MKLIPKPIHPFPARMAAAIPWEELKRPQARPLRVLDPMSGSGTSLVVARTLGHEAVGFDTDPLAVLLAKTWCSDVDGKSVGIVALRVLDCARVLFKSMSVSEAYPVGADEETREFVRYWFDPTNRRQLAALAAAIRDVTPVANRNALWCAFSRLIITKQASASRALDLAHSRPHRVDDRMPIRPFEHFLGAVSLVLAGTPFGSAAGARPPQASVRKADARRLPLDDGTVDVIITSPPYLNAIDYLRAHKFSLVWMGHTVGALRTIRGGNIGTEAARGAAASAEPATTALSRMGNVEAVSPRLRSMLVRYIDDMNASVAEMARVLVPRGKAILVVGDCTMRGTYISNSRAITALAEHHGLRLTKAARRRLPANRRYLPPPSAGTSGSQLQSRMRTEVILRLEKAA